MRRTLVLAALAAAFAGTTMPAANAYLLNGCNSGDYVVADVVVASTQVAKVCTTDNPVTTVTKVVNQLVCLPCIVK